DAALRRNDGLYLQRDDGEQDLCSDHVRGQWDALWLDEQHLLWLRRWGGLLHSSWQIGRIGRERHLQGTGGRWGGLRPRLGATVFAPGTMRCVSGRDGRGLHGSQRLGLYIKARASSRLYEEPVDEAPIRPSEPDRPPNDPNPPGRTPLSWPLHRDWRT